MKVAPKLPEPEDKASRPDASQSASGAGENQAPDQLRSRGVDSRYDGSPADPAVHDRWPASPLGKLTESQEFELVSSVLPRRYNPVSVQVGSLGGRDLMGETEAAVKVIVGDMPSTEAGVCHVRADPVALPFGERSIDLALLAHALDFSANPHQVLREVDQTLAPDGHIVIVGFNPLSLFGLRKAFGRLVRRDRRTPWGGSWLRSSRVQDWLTLLGYEITAGKRCMYALPFQSQRLVEKFDFLERAGNRWWPRFGAIYVVVARKREIAGTPLALKKSRRRKIGSRITAPVTRGANANTGATRGQILVWPHQRNDTR